jgi:hypothetical protein
MNRIATVATALGIAGAGVGGIAIGKEAGDDGVARMWGPFTAMGASVLMVGGVTAGTMGVELLLSRKLPRLDHGVATGMAGFGAFALGIGAGLVYELLPEN